MVYIKTKEGASLWIALLATAIVAGTMTLLDAVWWVTLCVCGAVFVVVALVALFIIRKYVAYKLKPIYSIVLSRDVHTHEIFSELKDKHVENIGEELTAWADTNDKEIARLKETEQFRKQYLGNVAHELKTPIFNIQGYISTLLDGGLEDELINPQIPRTGRKEHRPPDQHRERPRYDLQTRKQHEPPEDGAVRHRCADQGDRRAGPRWRPTKRGSRFRSKGPKTCRRLSGCWPTSTISVR